MSQRIERLIAQRSRFLVGLLWVFFLLDMSKFVVDDRPSFWTAGVGLALLIITTIVVYRQRWPRLSMYVIVVLFQTYTLVLMVDRPSVVNYVFAWIGLIVSAYYQEYGPIWLAGGLCAAFQAYSFLTYGSLAFPNSRPMDLIYPLLLCAMIVVFLLNLTSFTKRLWLSAERAEQRLRYVLENADVVTWAINQFGEGIAFSEGVSNILGLSAEEFRQHPALLLELTHPDDVAQVQSLMREVAGGERRVAEFRVLRPDGEMRWVQCRAFPTTDGAGKARGMQGVLMDVTKRRLVDEQVKFLAYNDQLTGIPNYHFFLETAKNSLPADANAEMYAVLFIDLDGFKQVNDSAGHEVGDQVLAEVAQRLWQSWRDQGLFCRLGGDEFALLLGISDQAEAIAAAKRIVDVISEPIPNADRTFQVGCSIGISYYPEHGTNVSALLKYADAAMYQAKVDQSVHWQVYQPDAARA